jgi:hypothetical protein
VEEENGKQVEPGEREVTEVYENCGEEDEAIVENGAGSGDIGGELGVSGDDGGARGAVLPAREAGAGGGDGWEGGCTGRRAANKALRSSAYEGEDEEIKDDRGGRG